MVTWKRRQAQHCRAEPPDASGRVGVYQPRRPERPSGVRGFGYWEWGVVAGIGMAFWISRGLASVLFQVGAWDAPTVAGVALVLIFTSLAACAFPALRASRIAPVIAMRHE